MMDFTYYNQNCYVEVYSGVLTHEVNLQQKIHPLLWMLVEEDFFDLSRFAGEGNIGHMVEQVSTYGMGQPDPRKPLQRNTWIKHEWICIGIDGCKGPDAELLCTKLLYENAFPTEQPEIK